MGGDPDWRGSPSSRSVTSIRIFAVFFSFVSLLPVTEAQHSICGSIDIRNDARTVFNKEKDDFLIRYMNCTILEGTFSLSMITNSSTSEDDFVTFPNLVEITGYLLVFNVKSLTSLSRIFPNLRVIGGSQLIMNYALIIYQNPDLKDVGLPNLRVIRNGGIRISENPSLCFVVQIDWKRLTFGQIDDVLVADGEASGAVCNDECDDSHSRCVKRVRDDGAPVISCWNASTCQELCPFDIVGNTTKKELGPGCLIGEGGTGVVTSDDSSIRCHHHCIAGCYEKDDPSQCVSCAGYLYDGKCVARCPKGMFKYLSRCVTEMECIDSPEVRVDDDWRQYKAVNSQCVYDCPPGYQQEKMKRNMSDGSSRDQEYCVKCQGPCPKKCKGKALDTIAMAKDLAGCNVIEGNLDIQLRDSSKMTMLTEALKDIQIIEGHLLIRFSPSLTSLSMFQQLREIRGKDKFQNRYALVIYENQNLNALFSPDVVKNMNVSGLVQVQNNRNLCFPHIEKMMKALGQEVNAEDQSRYSNGDKAICDETNLVLSYEKVMSEGFILKWTPFNTSDIDHRKFLGYQVFYKQVESGDVSTVQIEQDRSVCSDTWTMYFEPDKERKTGGEKEIEENGTLTREEETRMVYNGVTRLEEQLENRMNVSNPGLNPNFVHAVITHDGILPNTFYAAYVQTKMVNHPGAKNARSNVIIVETQFSNPSPPKITAIHPIGTDELEVQWEESFRPNGNITHYIVTWHTQYRDISYEVKHACDALGERRRMPPMPSATVSPSATVAQQSFVASIAGQPEDSCTAKGCCPCDKEGSPSISSLYGEDDEENNNNLDRNHDFENAVQNIVFVPSCKYAHDPNRCGRFSTAARKKEADRETDPMDASPSPPTHRPRRRRRRPAHSSTLPTLYRIREEGGYRIIQEDAPKYMREKRSIIDVEKEEKKDIDLLGKAVLEGEKEKLEGEEKEMIVEKDTGETETEEVVMPYKPGYLLDGKDEKHLPVTKNVTATGKKNQLTITGLRHATTYQIAVIACQDASVEPHFCSLKPAYKSQRTAEIKENDEVPASSIVTTVLNHTTTGAAFVRFDAPPQPNGKVHGFTVTLVNVNDELATPISHCVNSSIFAGGVIIRGLADGTYVPSIVTLTGIGGSLPVKGPSFTIRSPPLLTLPRVLIGLLLMILLVSIVGCVIMKATRTMVGKKLGEYVRQTITANPEYLSQFDVYKTDEWELDRSLLTLGEEIGRGTFGKVYRGWGDQIRSQCGTVFDECAIKTVSEDANPAERLHFLIEASVMKQFNSAFIIHLYGVVSDGQPVLVVMELMAKGNLRDYLRSRRPDAEENTDQLVVPEDSEILEWGAQIADGMSYLESLKFCHRDLAARNCMIGADDVVKIGDFGMARDIYYHEYYKPTGKRMMPVRWMAPESLKDGKFSLKSDVWAYGIVLYEMMTLAQQPYQGLANDEVFNFIGVTRRVLERPVDCPDFWYELMVQCWQYNPKDRPTFREIVECLCVRASADFREVYDRFKERSWVLNEGGSGSTDNVSQSEDREEVVIDEDSNPMYCMDNRRGRERHETDDFSDRGTDLMHTDDEDSV